MKFENMPRYSKYLCWYTTELEKKRSVKEMVAASVVMLIVVGLFSLLMVRCTNEPQPIYKSHLSEKEQKFIEVFKDHGSTQPVEMAIAVCKTKKPDLMAALAIRESNGNPLAVGDGGKSKGAFQVWPSHHGSVSDTASEQALQAERILEELVQSSRGRLRSGLAKYNGGRKPPKISYKRASEIIKLSRTVRRKV